MATVGLCENGGPHSIHCLKKNPYYLMAITGCQQTYDHHFFGLKLPFYNIVLCTKSVHVIPQEILILYMTVSQTVCPH